MIYVDTSVLLAQLLAEDRSPSDQWWQTPGNAPFLASRLLTYECWTRIHARGLAATHGDTLRAWLSRLTIVELHPAVLARTLEPFPHAVRTLDAMHLASMVYLRSRGYPLRLATYDLRLADAAIALGFEIVKP